MKWVLLYIWFGVTEVGVYDDEVACQAAAHQVRKVYQVYATCLPESYHPFPDKQAPEIIYQGPKMPASLPAPSRPTS